MSISTTATKDSYAGNNSIVTQYPITFKYFEESHISVYFDGVLQTKGAGADYVMGGDGTTSTGYITTNVAQADTVTVAIVLDVPFDQPVVLQETGSLPAKTIEVEGFDRLNMQVRRVWRKLQDVLTFNTDEAGASTGTADNLIGFDGSGDIAEIPNTTFLQTANDLSDVTAATARTNLGVDPAGTDNSTDVTKTGAGTYISLAGQVLTVDAITESDISDLGAYIENVTSSPLSELQDVTITTPSTGQVISWNGSAWVNTAVGNGDALVANGLDQFAATSSLELKDTISDETGGGALVFATSPTLVTPALGTPTAIDLANATNTPLPAAGTVTEAMLNTSANLSLDKADTSMQPTTYDPNTVAGDAFDSANHTYTPAGTGAVDTVVETKLRESVSVKDFGAVGDGVADDTTKIQAAIDYAYLQGGGTVHLPVGRYMVSQIEVPQRVILQGDTAGFGAIYDNTDVAPRGSVLFGITGTNADIVTITMRLETNETETTLGYPNPDARHHGGLRDITVWGNRSLTANPPATRSLNTAGHCIHIKGARFVQLHNVIAAFAADVGIYMSSFDYGTTDGSLPSNNMIWANTSAISNYSNGFSLTGGDNSFSQLQAGYNGSDGIFTVTSASTFSACYAWNNERNGIYFFGSGDSGKTIITGCRAYDNKSNGFKFDGDQSLLVTACQARANGRDTAETVYAGVERSNFHVTAGANGLVLSGCQSSYESPYDQYGFYINNTTYDVTLTGCQADDSAIAGYSFAAGLSKIRSSSNIGTNKPLHSGFVAEGSIDMSDNAITNIKYLTHNSWQTLSTVTSNTLACGFATMIALNMSSPETVNDITTSLTGIPIIVIRNLSANAVTFTYNNAKLRNNSKADIVLGSGECISYAYVSGAVWQQI